MGRVVVIGGGIAGVATARALARRGREVTLFEQETTLGFHSTGRNAAIFRLAVREPVNVVLALRTRAIGEELVSGGVVESLGGLYLSDDASEREEILDAAAGAGVREAGSQERPSLLSRRERPALFSPHDGVIDVHALLSALAADARRHGVRFQPGVRVEGLVREAGRVTGVRAREELPAEVVVDATGAFSPALPDAPARGIHPHRRHLFVLDTPEAKRLSGVVWDLTEGVYLRPESGGLLVSACDETPMAAGDVPVDTEIAGVLFDKLARWAPTLADARVRRLWAGLRPLTRDHCFVVGPDPDHRGLFRVGGFGGHGMTAGAAAGEWAAEMICGAQIRFEKELAPGRPGLC